MSYSSVDLSDSQCAVCIKCVVPVCITFDAEGVDLLYQVRICCHGIIERERERVCCECVCVCVCCECVCVREKESCSLNFSFVACTSPYFTLKY